MGEDGITATHRCSLFGFGGGSGRTRIARRDAGHHDGRIWPNATLQQERRPRSLAVLLQCRAGRRRREGRPGIRCFRSNRSVPDQQPRHPPGLDGYPVSLRGSRSAHGDLRPPAPALRPRRRDARTRALVRTCFMEIFVFFFLTAFSARKGAKNAKSENAALTHGLENTRSSSLLKIWISVIS